MPEANQANQVVPESQGEMWMSVLEFLCLELFGPEITEKISNSTPKGYPVQQGEKVLNIKLSDWEKRLFSITDAMYELKNSCGEEWRGYELSSFRRIADALREIFWSHLTLTHKELRNINYGVRQGFLVVETLKEDRKSPIEGIFGGAFPLPPGFPPRR